jgi:hypothetical protein
MKPVEKPGYSQSADTYACGFVDCRKTGTGPRKMLKYGLYRYIYIRSKRKLIVACYYAKAGVQTDPGRAADEMRCYGQAML